MSKKEKLKPYRIKFPDGEYEFWVACNREAIDPRSKEIVIRTKVGGKRNGTPKARMKNLLIELAEMGVPELAIKWYRELKFIFPADIRHITGWVVSHSHDAQDLLETLVKK